MTTIAQLWNGNLEPVRYLGVNNSVMHELEKLIQNNFENLQKCLGTKEKELLDRYRDCLNEYIFISCEQAFCDGFCIGTKIFAEALNGAEKII